MSGVERSAALRRMGITEWLLRDDDAAVLSVAEAAAQERVSAVPLASSAAPLANASPRTAAAVGEHSNVVSAPVASSSPTVVSSPARVPAVAEQKAVATIAVPSPTSAASAGNVPGLRGRLLASRAGGSVLVLALTEKSARDAMLQPDTAAGALLNAMLEQLPVPAAVALIGVERGEPLPVPATILVLGERSARLLLGNEVAMPLRGRVHLFGQSRVVVSYHPDELRQNGSLKRLAWDDLRLLAGLLNPVAGTDVGSR